MAKTPGLLAKLEAGGFSERQVAENAASQHANRALAALVIHALPQYRATYELMGIGVDYRRPGYMALVNSFGIDIDRWRRTATLVRQPTKTAPNSYGYEVVYHINESTFKPYVALLAVTRTAFGWSAGQVDTFAPKRTHAMVYWLDGKIPVPADASRFFYHDHALYEGLVQLHKAPR